MNAKIIRALKDPSFRATLSDAERAELESPIGAIELDEAALEEVQGGASYLSFCRTVCGVYCTLTNIYDCIGG